MTKTHRKPISVVEVVEEALGKWLPLLLLSDYQPTIYDHTTEPSVSESVVEWDAREKTINLKLFRGVTENQRLESTVIHECLHVVMGEVGIPVSEHNEALVERLAEILRRIGRMLTQNVSGSQRRPPEGPAEKK